MALPSKVFDQCWLFIRGDLAANDFEKWVYATTELQEIFSEDFYMHLISTDFSSSGPVFVLKEKLEDAINELAVRDCDCHTLPSLADVGMGQHNQIFKSLNEKAKYGEPLWWLWLAQCTACEEFWMIASEERINDVFIMKRLSLPISQRIIEDNHWPDDFKKFETLLRIGKERNHSVRFLNPVS